MGEHSVTIAASVSYDLDVMLENLDMKLDPEKLATDSEYREEIKDIIYDKASEDLGIKARELNICDSDIEALID